MNKADLITIKTHKPIDNLLLVFWVLLFVVSILTLFDKETFKTFRVLIPIASIGLFFAVLKCTKKIIFDLASKKVKIKNLIFKKIIAKDEILCFQRINSASYGDWYGIVLKKDKYGKPIQISFPPKLTTNIQKHADTFEKETLPILNDFLN